MSVATPIVFIIFNRPDLTQIVFESIRKAKPQKLLIIADGARFSEEIEKCQAARDIIKQVDWECEVFTNYSDINLGCGVRIATGLDWAFSLVEEAIIIEDDCLPAPSFFKFCQTLLEHYRHDTRIMHISGNNFQEQQSRTPYSYYFSRYPHCWGWATWRRAWRYFDFKIPSWSEFKAHQLIKFVCDDVKEQEFWTNLFDRAHNGLQDVWDYQWTYTCFSQRGLAILPDVNMVSNLGFRSDATHTKEENVNSELPTVDILKIKHPPFVICHQDADAYSFDHVFGGKNLKECTSIHWKIYWLILNTLKRIRGNYESINSQTLG